MTPVIRIAIWGLDIFKRFIRADQLQRKVCICRWCFNNARDFDGSSVIDQQRFAHRFLP
jgi:hypothetical protein